MAVERLQITSLKAPPPGWTWDPDRRERELAARFKHRTLPPDSIPSAAPVATVAPPPPVRESRRITVVDAWTKAQDDVLWQWAGLEPPARLAELCSGVGPPRTKAAVLIRAHTLRIPLRKRRRRVYEKTGWTGEEEAMLRRLAGRRPLVEITRLLNQAFGTRRRDGGVQHRATKLGVSTRVGGLLKAGEVRQLLAIGWVEMERMLRSGELVADRRSVGKGGDWGISEHALAEYIRLHHARLRWQTMPPGRWRELARLASIRDPYVTLAEAVRLSGRSQSAVSRCLVAGRVPGAVKVRRVWRIPSSAIASLKEPPPRERPPTIIDRVLAALGPTYQRCHDLASATGTTESGVYAAIKALRRGGHRIDQRSGQGYRLRERVRAEMAS